jgi:signal transduction histidine kinase
MRTAPVEGLRRAQVRITAVALAGMVAVVLVAGLTVVRVFERELRSQIDEDLRDTASFVQRGEAAGSLPTEDPGGGVGYVQVTSEDGEVVYATPRLGDEPPFMGGQLGGAGVITTADTAQGPLRVIEIAFRGQTLVFGQPMEPVDDAVTSLVRSLLIGASLLAVGLAALVWVTVGWALRPVGRALQRERRLVADASHELRSPLTGVRVLLESEPDDLEVMRRNRRDALATVSRLESIADDLLLLSSQDWAGGPDHHQLVDLEEPVLRQVHIARETTAVEIDSAAVSGGQVTGSEADLERLVENLLSNAVRHADRCVEVSVEEIGDKVWFVVSDDGDGVPEQERERVFERFTRLDDARSRDQGGAGLGLAIVAEVAAAHGGAVAIGERDRGGARFSVWLPAATASAGGADHRQ